MKQIIALITSFVSIEAFAQTERTASQSTQASLYFGEGDFA